MKAETVETDVLIIGGGAAGCCAALRAHELGAKVLMVVKGKMGRSGGTPLAASLSARARLPLPYPLFKPLKQLYSSISEVVRLPMPAKYEKTLRAALESHYWLVDQDYFLDLALWLDKEFFPSLEASGIYVLRDDEGNPEVPPGNRPQYAMQGLRIHGVFVRGVQAQGGARQGYQGHRGGHGLFNAARRGRRGRRGDGSRLCHWPAV